jgi:hypothetical protein
MFSRLVTREMLLTKLLISPKNSDKARVTPLRQRGRQELKEERVEYEDLIHQ